MWKTKWGKCIYTSPSGCKVYQNLFFRWLTFGSTALQTVIRRRNPQKPILYYLPALTLMARKYPDDSCLLGLGGAGVAHMLSSDNPNSLITAVDCSEEVIQIAKRFFMADRIHGLTIELKNAADYVRDSNKQYKHLIVDLYDANNFPAECNNNEFFINCRNRLKKDGILAVNLANYNEQLPISNLVKSHFNNTLVIPVIKSANLIILASMHENKEQFINTIRETGEMKKIVWMDLWGYVGTLL